MIVSVGLFFVLWALRKRLQPAGMIFFLFLFLNGLERFFIEKIRVNVKVLGNITQAEIIATLLMIARHRRHALAAQHEQDAPSGHGHSERKLTEGQVEAISIEIAAFIREEAPKFTEAGVNTKSANNLVTHVDHTAEDRIVEALEKLLPERGLHRRGRQRRARPRASTGSSIRWTAPPTSCMACRATASASPWSMAPNPCWAWCMR